MSTTLTPPQVEQFHEQGFLLGRPPVYTPEEMAERWDKFNQLLGYLEPGETPKDIREWHEASRWLYDVAMNRNILDVDVDEDNGASRSSPGPTTRGPDPSIVGDRSQKRSRRQPQLQGLSGPGRR